MMQVGKQGAMMSEENTQPAVKETEKTEEVVDLKKPVADVCECPPGCVGLPCCH
jgi:hypothetical protein